MRLFHFFSMPFKPECRLVRLSHWNTIRDSNCLLTSGFKIRVILFQCYMKNISQTTKLLKKLQNSWRNQQRNWSIGHSFYLAILAFYMLYSGGMDHNKANLLPSLTPLMNLYGTSSSYDGFRAQLLLGPILWCLYLYGPVMFWIQNFSA